MNSKTIRYLFGIFLLMMTLFSFYYSKIALFVMAVFIILIAINEYRNMFKKKEICPHSFLPEIIGIFCSYIFIFKSDIAEHNIITPVITIGIILSFILTVLKNSKPYILTSLSTICAIVLTFCGLYVIKLTYYFEHLSSFYVIAVYFLTVLSGDYAASVVGLHCKNKKFLAAEISPEKTLQGAAANLVVSCLICLLFVKLLNFSIIKCIIFGCVISVFSQFGDLAVSTIKRDLGIKHSGNMFYVYGGILDRLDAFIFSAPAAYYFLYLISVV